jgi:LacI family transcriptional regulator
VNSATIRDVARAASVSVATVSRTLNGIDSVAEKTRDRVLRAAGELDYVPNSGARALSTRRTDTIGVLLPDLHGEFFSELIRGIDLAARANGLHLLLSSSHGDPAEAAAALRAMRSRVDSIILMLPQGGEDLLFAAGIGAGTGAVPMVFLGQAAAKGGHCSLAIDNYAGASAITEHLLASGRRRVAFVAGPADNADAGERLRGYRAAMRRAGLDERVVDGDFSEQAGRDAARHILAGQMRPDALFCANDMMAIGALDALKDAGVAVPGDIALAGFDDIPIARYVSPPLTTAAVPIAEIGRQALECCAATIAGRKTDQQRTFTPQLVVRASSPTNSNHAD